MQTIPVILFVLFLFSAASLLQTAFLKNTKWRPRLRAISILLAIVVSASLITFPKATIMSCFTVGITLLSVTEGINWFTKRKSAKLAKMLA